MQSKLQRINYFRKSANDYARLYHCYEELIIRQGYKFYYLNLYSNCESHKCFVNYHIKKFRENYIKKTNFKLFGFVEHTGKGKDYHLHAVLLFKDEPDFDLLDESIKQHWQRAGGTTKRLFRPQVKAGDNNGALGAMFYMAKAQKYRTYVKTLDAKSSFIWMNLETLPWAGKQMPGISFHRPNIPNITKRFFEDNRADPAKGEEAKIIPFPLPKSRNSK